jgi:UDP-N-acetylglucosamine 4,6-dehydratase
MNMMDLARAICPKCKTEIIGIRPGEKLHEVMVPKDDARRTLEYEDYYLIQPDFRFFDRRFDCKEGKPVSGGFEYNSETNPWKLSVEEMRSLIKEI